MKKNNEFWDRLFHMVEAEHNQRLELKMKTNIDLKEEIWFVVNKICIQIEFDIVKNEFFLLKIVPQHWSFKHEPLMNTILKWFFTKKNKRHTLE